MKKEKINIIGVPMDYGGNRRGVDMGPSAVRYSGLKKSISQMGLTYKDSGDIIVPLPENKNHHMEKIEYVDEIIKVNEKLYNKVMKAHENDMFPIAIGGDHSLAVGSCLASLDYYKNIGVVWIDAHADFNNAETSLTGNIHGMPLSAIAGYCNGFLSMKNRIDKGYVKDKNIVIVAARDLDKAEVEMLRELDITVLSMQYIDKYGMHDTMKTAIKIASDGTNGIHVSFDIDAISPAEAPGVGTPVKGGLTFREAHLAMELMHESDNMISLDVVELNPITDNNNATGNLAVKLIESALGKNII